jgi:DNA-binding transcriptional regulator YiaG
MGDEKRGLDVPEHIQRQRKPEKKALEDQRAKVLEYLSDHELADTDELLRQIEIGASEFLSGCTEQGTETGAAVLCKGIASGLRGALKDNENARTLILLGYMYGGLISPNPEAFRQMVKKLLARQAGASKGGEAGAAQKKAVAAQRKAKAKRIWDREVANGRQERGLAQVVAHRIGVSDKTVREWRKAGW